MKKTTPTTKKTKGGSKESEGAASPSKLIDTSIKELGDWRGATLARVRALIKQADPEVVEEWKWGIPVWSHAGIICTGETYKNAVKTTFAKGASIKDPSGLFNSSLEGATRRAIDFREGDKINEKALKALIRAAVELNTHLDFRKIERSLELGDQPRIVPIVRLQPIRAHWRKPRPNAAPSRCAARHPGGREPAHTSQPALR